LVYRSKDLPPLGIRFTTSILHSRLPHRKKWQKKEIKSNLTMLVKKDRAVPSSSVQAVALACIKGTQKSS